MVSKLCAYGSLRSTGICIPSPEADQDDVSTCTYTEAKAHVPSSPMQKIMQKLVISNIKDETLGYVSYINNKPKTKTRAVNTTLPGKICQDRDMASFL
jgi:hypothetical protein